mmetsp:Transcript_39485/g.108781  ORF Transcript_39485/g.108781 Transcript_39485/m.108781 type:complete len:406 (+) Transcript_39485:1867-3084(+)
MCRSCYRCGRVLPLPGFEAPARRCAPRRDGHLRHIVDAKPAKELQSLSVQHLYLARHTAESVVLVSTPGHGRPPYRRVRRHEEAAIRHQGRPCPPRTATYSKAQLRGPLNLFSHGLCSGTTICVCAVHSDDAVAREHEQGGVNRLNRPIVTLDETRVHAADEETAPPVHVVDIHAEAPRPILCDVDAEMPMPMWPPDDGPDRQIRRPRESDSSRFGRWLRLLLPLWCRLSTTAVATRVCATIGFTTSRRPIDTLDCASAEWLPRNEKRALRREVAPRDGPGCLRLNLASYRGRPHGWSRCRSASAAVFVRSRCGRKTRTNQVPNTHAAILQKNCKEAAGGVADKAMRISMQRGRQRPKKHRLLQPKGEIYVRAAVRCNDEIHRWMRWLDNRRGRVRGHRDAARRA